MTSFQRAGKASRVLVATQALTYASLPTTNFESTMESYWFPTCRQGVSRSCGDMESYSEGIHGKAKEN